MRLSTFIRTLLALTLAIHAVPLAATPAISYPNSQKSHMCWEAQALALPYLTAHRSRSYGIGPHLKDFYQRHAPDRPATIPILYWLYNGLARIHPLLGYILAPAITEWAIVYTLVDLQGRSPSWWLNDLMMLAWWAWIHFLPPWRYFIQIADRDIAAGYLKSTYQNYGWVRPYFWTAAGLLFITPVIALADSVSDPLELSSIVFVLSHAAVLQNIYRPYSLDREWRGWVLVDQYLRGFLIEPKHLPVELRKIANDLELILTYHKLRMIQESAFIQLRSDLNGRVIPWFVLPRDFRNAIEGVVRFDKPLPPITKRMIAIMATSFDVPKKIRGPWAWRRVGRYLHRSLSARIPDHAERDLAALPADLQETARRLEVILNLASPSEDLLRRSVMEQGVFKAMTQPLRSIRTHWGKPEWWIIPEPIQQALQDLQDSLDPNDHGYVRQVIRLFSNVPTEISHPTPPISPENQDPPSDTTPKGGSDTPFFRRAA